MFYFNPGPDDLRNNTTSWYITRMGVVLQDEAARASASSVTVSACDLSALCFPIICKFGLKPVYMESAVCVVRWAVMGEACLQKPDDDDDT